MLRKVGKNIVILSVFDYCGSGYRAKEALSLTTNNNVEYFCFCQTPFAGQFKRYPTLYKLDRKDQKTYIVSKDDIVRTQLILNDADVVILKGDELPKRNMIQGVIIPKHIPIISAVSGTIFRRKDPKIKLQREMNSVTQGVYPIKDYIDLTSARVAMNPDLNYQEFDAMYIPFSYDTTAKKRLWRKPDGKIIIGHSPSDQTKKGTSQLIEAINHLKRNGYNVEMDIISGVSHEECLRRKSLCNVFYDQNLAGSYGNAAVESMAIGIPVLAWMPQTSINQSDGRLADSPVVDTGQTTKTMIEAIKKVLTMDIEDLSIRTKEWCDGEHSYEVTGALWEIACNKALGIV